MRVVLFASGGGGNLRAAISASRAYPELVSIDLVITDRPGILAIQIAQDCGIPVYIGEFEKECGRWREGMDKEEKELYLKRSIHYHDRILAEIQRVEERRGAVFDLAVLSYRRWIYGGLLSYFNERMINQHAGDLTIMTAGQVGLRRYVGINPVFEALRSGEVSTRTTTFLVREGHDSGEILCQGPWVDYDGSQLVSMAEAHEHENRQKEFSDWPALKFALLEIARGNLSLCDSRLHADGNKVVYYCGEPLPYGGVDLNDWVDAVPSIDGLEISKNRHLQILENTKNG